MPRFFTVINCFYIAGASHPLNITHLEKKRHPFSEKEKETINGGKEGELLNNRYQSSEHVGPSCIYFMFRYILYCAITQWRFDRLKLENGLIQ